MSETHDQLFTRLEIKGVSDAGEFEGYASTFGNEDLGGDIVMPGAFTKTISENKNVPILWAHNTREVIGVNKAFSEDAKGLKVTGQLVMEVQRAREVHGLMKAGAVKGLSIGYDAIRTDMSRYAKDGVRGLAEVKLYEYSLLPFPMNPEAQVTGIKTVADLERLLTRIVAFKGDVNLSEEKDSLVLMAIEKLSALRAAKAPGAAKQDEIAPEVLHAFSERTESIEKLLRGEL